MKNKGFTLIELLAVIIILGILMLIAIPSVTTYINNSRKNTYVSTIQELIKAASTKVNSGELDIYDTDTTYYIPVSALELENGKAHSPYGEFDEAYVVVTYDGEEYDYYYVGKDETSMGIKDITKNEYIDKDDISSVNDDIDTSICLEGTEYVVVFDDNLNKGPKELASDYSYGGVDLPIICKRAAVETLHTETCNNNFNSPFPQYTYYCKKAGYSIGDTITYGNTTTTEGVLNTGDAFDCDVNGDGTFDTENERFYFVSNYYNTDTRSFDSKTAVLIYSDCVYNEEKSPRKSLYNESGNESIYDGPVSALQHLPSLNTWSNVSLKKTSRIIYSVDFNNKTVSTAGRSGIKYAGADSDHPKFEYVYNGIPRASRLLSLMELAEGCLNSLFATHYNYYLNSCLFLFEHSQFANSSYTYQYNSWLETPEYDDLNTKKIVVIASNEITIGFYEPNSLNASYPAVCTRPAIEVPVVQIEK